MASPNGLTLWVMAGAGTLFLYSAFKGHNPLKVVESATSAPAGQPVAPASAPNSLDVTPSSYTGTESFGATVYGPQAAAYTVAPDGSGTQTVYGADGSIVENLPATYSSNPGSYIPPASVLNA